jgi:hypothetical protein
MNAPSDHPPLEALLDWWLHDSDAAATEAVDEHLMRCDICGDTLDALIALGAGVRAAVRAGAVAAVTSGAFVQHLAAQGLKLREYHVAVNGSVNCSVAPEDDLLVTRLEAPLAGVQRLDLLSQLSTEPGVPHELQDIPFDPASGAVFYLHRMTQMRQMPTHTAQVTLLAVEAGGRRELGRYTFHHRPWPPTPATP